jgi:hypothetical protein
MTTSVIYTRGISLVAGGVADVFWAEATDVGERAAARTVAKPERSVINRNDLRMMGNSGW